MPSAWLAAQRTRAAPGEQARAGEEARSRIPLRVKGRRAGGAGASREWGVTVAMLLPGALIVYLGFDSGGVFAGATATAALLTAAATLACLALAPRPLAPRPLARPSPTALVAIGSLALFAFWTWLSSAWSHAPGQALVALDRVLLYLLVLCMFAFLPQSPSRFRWLLRGLLAGCAIVVAAGLISRLLPSLWPTQPGLEPRRLSYPITYWNSYGLLAGMGCLLSLHHACDSREPGPLRVLAASLLPPLSAALLLSYSRGALAVTLLGALAYLAIARPSGLLGALLAAAPTSAIALWQANSATLLQGVEQATSAGVAQGRRLALVLAGCAALAALVRTLDLPLDGRGWPGLRLPSRTATRGTLAASALAALAFGFAALRLEAPVRELFTNFASETHHYGTQESSRLLSVGNDGRMPMWRVAAASFSRDPLLGSGAGTFRVHWERNRRSHSNKVFVYSLYLEVLAELGVVGLLVLAAALLSLLVALGSRARGPEGRAYAIGFALALVWALHASVDWDWQTPAVTIPVFALGGAALARSDLVGSRSHATLRRGAWPASGRASATSPWLGLAAVALCLAFAVVPAEMALAQARLRASVEALGQGRCELAQTRAREALATIDVGPRPYEVLAICAARQGNTIRALAWARGAVSEEPSDWEPHFVLALTQGVAGVDPRAQLRAAYEDNPLGSLTRIALSRFSHAGSRAWGYLARGLPFSFE